MPGGRAQSARSDTSDIEQHVETMMELKKLERSYRIMEKDRKAYTQESQQHINRQRYSYLFNDLAIVVCRSVLIYILNILNEQKQ